MELGTKEVKWDGAVVDGGRSTVLGTKEVKWDGTVVDGGRSTKNLGNL